MADEFKWYAPKQIRCNCHAIVRAAVKLGLLGKQTCEECGADNLVAAHHDDYSRPLQVRWLCRDHHFKFHAVHMQIGKVAQLSGEHKPIISDRARAGHTKRARSWRERHPDKYNAYMAEYMRRKRANG